MKRNFLLVLLSMLLLAQVFAAQTIKSDKLDKFTKVELSGNLSTELIPSGFNSIEIELVEGDLSKLKWSLEQGVLKVALKSSMGQDNQPRANVKIYYTELSGVEISGGTVRTSGAVIADLFDLKASGEAIVNFQAQCLDVYLNASGNSVVQIEGITKYLIVEASEKSKLDMRSLSSVSVNATASSLAEVFVFVQQRLVARAKSGATVNYKGEPSILRALTPKIIKFGAKVNSLE